MTPSEMNIAIAKACGWEYCPGRSLNYVSDLNAMHEAEREIDTDALDPKSNYWRYQLELSKATNAKRLGPLSIIRATARQRGEAFLRTMNLWKEDVDEELHDPDERTSEPGHPAEYGD